MKLKWQIMQLVVLLQSICWYFDIKKVFEFTVNGCFSESIQMNSKGIFTTNSKFKGIS